MPEVYRQLREITDRLEKHYRDVQDFEFTIQRRGSSFSCRPGPESAPEAAAIKIAVDHRQRGSDRQARPPCFGFRPGDLDQLLHHRGGCQGQKPDVILAKGLPASPGAAVGKAVFNGR